MAALLTPETLLDDAGLVALGPWSWNEGTMPDEPGVYTISVEDPTIVCIERPARGLVSEEQLLRSRSLWKADQKIVYIGRASTSLRKRLKQFYSHKHGKRSPHAGGQSILLIDAPLVIHCAIHPDTSGSEDRLIRAFEGRCGRKPFGNKVKAALKKAAAPLG